MCVNRVSISFSNISVSVYLILISFSQKHYFCTINTMVISSQQIFVPLHIVFISNSSILISHNSIIVAFRIILVPFSWFLFP